jgi:predicted nucleic-acid-binding Zn-ribbon protein
MEIEKKCLRCGSTNVKPSVMQSTGRIYSRPKPSKFTTVFTTGAQVSSLICFDCGHVELFVDVEQAKEILKTA